MAFALTPLLYMSVLADLPLTLRALIGLSSAARVGMDLGSLLFERSLQWAFDGINRAADRSAALPF
jgi:hypothetical protein